MSHVGLCIEILKERLIWEIATYPENGTVISTLVFFFQGRHLYTYCRWMVHVVLILFYIFIIILNSDFSRMSEKKNQSTESIKLMPRFAGYKFNITVYNNIWLLISRHLILCYIIIVFSKIYDPFLIYYSFWWGRHIMCYQIKLWYLVSKDRSIKYDDWSKTT